MRPLCRETVPDATLRASAELRGLSRVCEGTLRCGFPGRTPDFSEIERDKCGVAPIEEPCSSNKFLFYTTVKNLATII